MNHRVDARQSLTSPPGYTPSRLLIIANWSVTGSVAPSASLVLLVVRHHLPSTPCHANPTVWVKADKDNKNGMLRVTLHLQP